MGQEREAHYICFFQGMENGKSSLSLGLLSLLVPASNVVLEPLCIHFDVAAPAPPHSQLALDLIS